jgi:DNA-binding transcriptional LysR family regulator
LRVAHSWSGRFVTLPALGRALRAKHPDVELLAQEMWNAAMIPALRSGAVDIAIALCPELAPDLADEVIRTERVVAVLPATHPLAAEEQIPLSSLADETFVFFARELAPRLHDVLVGLCRRAGFEPKLRSGSFHTGWDLGILGQAAVVAIAPRSIRESSAEGVITVPLSEPADLLDTHLMWRDDDPSPIVEVFRSVARTAFDTDSGIPA